MHSIESMRSSSVLSLLGGLLLVEILVSYLRLRRALRRSDSSARSLARYPSVSVIRPVRGRDVGARENFAAALVSDYPGDVETLFVFDDESDPGLPVAREVIAAHIASGGRGTARVLIAGAPARRCTGKLNAMIQGVAAARGELIAFGDSDTRPDRHVLARLVEELTTRPTAGCTFAPVVVRGPLRTAGDVAYALLVNGLYGPSVAQLAAARGGTVPFIMGQLMVFRREALDAVGGVACAEGQLVDDMHIGKCLHEAGWQNVQIEHRLPIMIGGMAMKDFLVVFHRWLVCSRNGLPASFTWPQWLRAVEFWAALILTLVALAVSPAAALLPLAAVVAHGATMASVERLFGGDPVPARLAWVPFALVLATPLLFAMSLLRHDVDWRGRAYHVDWRHARLAS